MAPTRTALAVDFADAQELSKSTSAPSAKIFRFPSKTTEVHGPKLIASFEQYNAQIKMLEEMQTPKASVESARSRQGIAYYCE